MQKSQNLIMDCFVVFASLKLPRNDGEQHRFCDLIAESRPFMPKIC
ncbi:hypothetical protein [Helicobacter sp. 23-1045]